MKKLLYILYFIPLLCHSQNLIIGDSQTPYIDKNSSKVEKVRSLWKGGIGVDKLTSMVLNYKTSPDIKNIILCIGTNNNFRAETGNIKELFKVVKRTFPCARIYVIKGSWGWGGNKRVTEQRVNNYYKLYEQEGGIILEPAIGKYEPHQNLPVYKTIGRKLDSIL
jgi:hypothetical protein